MPVYPDAHDTQLDVPAEIVTLAEDEPPTLRVWHDLEDDDASGIVPTDEEARLGKLLGERIDPDDDNDNGLGYLPAGSGS